MIQHAGMNPETYRRKPRASGDDPLPDEHALAVGE